MIRLRSITTLLVGVAVALCSFSVSTASASPAKDKADVRAFAIKFNQDYLKSKSWKTVCSEMTPLFRSFYIEMANAAYKKNYRTCPQAMRGSWKYMGKTKRDELRATAKRYLRDLSKKTVVLVPSSRRNTAGYDALITMSSQANDIIMFSKIRGKWYYGPFKQVG